MPAAKRSTTEITCPACGANYRLSQWGVLKMLKTPKCERCGANLGELLRFKLQQRLQGAPAGETLCPRCGQSQEPAAFCKWCGNPLPQQAPSPGQAPGKPGPSVGLPWFRIFSTALVLLVLVMMPVFQEMQVPQAYETSKAFLMEDSLLAASLGGELQWGPFPFFFWRSTESPSGLWKGSFYFLARGARATVVVVVALEKPGRAKGSWKVVEGGYILDTAGNRKPLAAPPKLRSPRQGISFNRSWATAPPGEAAPGESLRSRFSRGPGQEAVPISGR